MIPYRTSRQSRLLYQAVRASRNAPSGWPNDLAADLPSGGLTLTAAGRPSTVTRSQATPWASPNALLQTLQALPNPQGSPGASWSPTRGAGVVPVTRLCAVTAASESSAPVPP